MASPSDSRSGSSPAPPGFLDANRFDNAGILSSSIPRADTTARLASPLPYGVADTPPRSSGLANQIHRSGSVTPLAGSIGGPSSAGPGISALATALSGPGSTSPPRFATPPIRSSTPPIRTNSPFPQGAMSNYGSFDSRSRAISGTGIYEDPEIIRRHLVQPTDAASDTSSRDGKGKSTVEDDEEFSSLRLQGGDVTRPIYKWAEEAEAKQRRQRSKSFTALRPEPEDAQVDINSIKIPGGFRRNFVRRAGGPLNEAGDNGELGGDGLNAAQPKLLTSSFLEFLTIYGHFAGEELEEDDEALQPGEYFSSGGEGDLYDGSYDGSSDSEDDQPMEDSALLTPSRRKRRRKSRGGSGTNSPMSAALLLLKSFVGTGVLFLPRAYLNGGMMFSNLVLLGVAALSYYCFVLLVTTRLKIVGSFGDIGGILYGKWMRNIILASIVLSQIGFVAAYIVFTSENLEAFILAVTDCKTTHIDISWLIVMQMIIFLPFSLLRDIGKLGFTALIADAFILVGLAYLFYYDILTLSTNGLADIIQFNEKDWTLFIGTAIFTFEGIGLIIPIQESMKQPSKFPKVMFVVMAIITTLFVTMGAVSYAAYGSKTETVVLLNLPQDNRMVNTVQLLYSVAILLSTPLQIFPAIRITENALFTKSGKYNPYIKWQKNVFRFLLVALCAFIAYCGADNLDKFVALVGNFACIPLVYIYPPMLHYKAVARSKLWRASDVALCIFGVIAMAYTTGQTMSSWASAPSSPETPRYCDGRL